MASLSSLQPSFSGRGLCTARSLGVEAWVTWGLEGPCLHPPESPFLHLWSRKGPTVPASFAKCLLSPQLLSLLSLPAQYSHTRPIIQIAVRGPQRTCSASLMPSLDQNSRTFSSLMLRVWSEDQQPWDFLGTHQKCRISAPPQTPCVLTSPGGSCAH